MLKMYDFICNSCGHAFEKLVPDLATQQCPKCQDYNTERVIAPLSIKVTGDGAYTNRMKV